MRKKDFSEVTPELLALTEIMQRSSRIDPALYDTYRVKRGLRDLNGNGVLTGLTEISEIVAKKQLADGTLVPCAGALYYRGIDIKKLIAGFSSENRFGFEETTYLLLFGQLPDKKALTDFQAMLGHYRCIPRNFLRDVIMKKPSRDIMNALSRSVLMLYSYDDRSVKKLLQVCFRLIKMLFGF